MKSPRTSLAAALVALAAVISPACGYSLAGRGSFLPDYIKTIGVPTFTNRSNVFNLETQLTQKVRSEFIGRGKYQIVPDSTNVDAVLTGEIISARPEVTSLGATPASAQLASRYAITVSASVQLRDLHENKVIWENQNMSFREEYDAQSGTSVQDPNAFFGQDANAMERLTTDFSHAIVSAILEAF
jgi:hypothetical protein